MNDQTSPKWLRISLNCPETVLEAISDLIGVVSGSGVEQTPVREGTSTITGFFRLDQGKSREQILDRLEKEITPLFQLYRLTAPEPVCTTMDDEDWSTSWQQFFKPFAIIPGLVIKPSWESYEPGPDEQVIEMDPGMAFGTGRHASTKLALKLIHDSFQNNPPKNVLDVGTGTGILAMAAMLFGAEQVVAIDNDPEAVRVATENIANNNLQHKINTSATELAGIRGRFDLVCANIVHDVLVDMAPAIARSLSPGGRLVLAGILCGTQEKSIIDIYRQLNITLLTTAHEDEWASLLL
ncbi:MAG: 50S ribosomal protein L11 methyltransferase, partial [Thermodesulfobacteriota bacterium]|nr:50S ribosomal protein L11 methyltransferase [Thermodesulfobacteriota bacterium]